MAKKLSLKDLSPPLNVFGDPTSKPANDNVATYSERRPIEEEFKAGRLGASQEENEASWEAVLFIGEAWNRLREDAGPYLTPGVFHHTGNGRELSVGSLSPLRGAERVAHFFSLWRTLDKRTAGGFSIVKRAVVDLCEMRDLAMDIPNRAKRAGVGRARLIAALPIVAEEVRLLVLADAA
jgi:hypothetical protein